LPGFGLLSSDVLSFGPELAGEPDMNDEILRWLDFYVAYQATIRQFSRCSECPKTGKSASKRDIGLQVENQQVMTENTKNIENRALKQDSCAIELPEIPRW
jgi:hypothetical protein